MITKPLRASGCAFEECGGDIAAVLELAVVTAGPGHVVMIQVPVCAVHGAGLDAPRNRKPVALFEFYRLTRAIVVEAQVVIDGESGRRRWPTYQELFRAAALGEKPR